MCLFADDAKDLLSNAIQVNQRPLGYFDMKLILMWNSVPYPAGGGNHTPRHADLSRLIVTVLMSRVWEEWEEHTDMYATQNWPRSTVRMLVTDADQLMSRHWCISELTCAFKPARLHVPLRLFFRLPHKNTHRSPPRPPSCLPLSRKNVPSDEGTTQRLTNVCAWCVCDWPCLGRPTQHHNSHDWVFSHCASQQTTAAHTAVGAEWVTVILRWLDWGFFASVFSPPCFISLHFNTHYFMSNSGEKNRRFSTIS